MLANLARSRRFVWVALAAGFILRVGVAWMAFPPQQALVSDSLYYVRIARHPLSLINGADVTSSGPLYPLFLIPFFSLLPDDLPGLQVAAVQLVQALLDTASVWLIYRIGCQLFDERAGLIALVAQVLDPRYVFYTATITTETLFIPLFTAFVLLYLTAAFHNDLRKYRLAGVLLGLATLTRPVPLLFPVLLAVHARFHPQDRRQAMKGVAWLVGLMLLVLAPWIVRGVLVTGEFVPVSDTFFSHFWLNSRPDGREISGGAFEPAVQEDIGTEAVGTTSGGDYLSAGLRNILDAPAQWAGKVIGDAARAYAQPYGTMLLIAPTDRGVKEVLRDFLSGGASFTDLLAIPALGRRLLMYLWHYWGLVGGLIGLVLALRKGWWRVFPLPAWVLYATAVTAVLLIEPRYVFPVMFAFTILAAYATLQAFEALWKKRSPPVTGEERV